VCCVAAAARAAPPAAAAARAAPPVGVLHLRHTAAPLLAFSPFRNEEEDALLLQILQMYGRGFISDYHWQHIAVTSTPRRCRRAVRWRLAKNSAWGRSSGPP
jgi:hypothetical protein